MSSKKPGTDKAPREGNGISRREFARRAAFATAAAATLPGAMLQDAVAAGPAPLHTNLAAAPTLPATPGDVEAETKIQAILVKYGSRLNDEQKADIRRLVAVTQKQIEKLRAYSVDNSDQPATILKPLMERPPRPASPAATTRAKAPPPAQKPNR